jgi:U3 small nucleolar RNA-associated protein 3
VRFLSASSLRAFSDTRRSADRETDGNDADGPRALTRAILKNRGLTPHRSKSVRNPRVKKREKYEKAKKRLSSQRAVFKDGPRDVTRYEGERSGISKVVKSVRF